MAEEQSSTIDVDKSGKTVISVGISRHRLGLKINVHVAPEVEDFFKHWSGGVQMDVSMMGRAWVPALKDVPFRVWNMPSAALNEGSSYDMIHVGSPLRINELVNISFVRLVGASTPDGVSFTSEEVVSEEEYNRLCERIKRNCGRFYVDFLKPIDSQITITSTKV